jgi:class 3 adenylate cyclase/energy-coupling factor transporter ATP-binding protein EcfA2
MADIRQWLIGLDLGEYAERFEAERVDLAAAIHLTEEDLKELSVPLGPRKKLLCAIEALRAASVEAGRRQVTVMFCDLVGSTALSKRLDPEDLRTLMGAYQQACGAVIERYDGHVAQYLGDGLMTYFGWPRAHENDAERAVQAGLEIVEAIKKLPSPVELSVRVGIATGPVVVGETGGGDPSVAKVAVGETPNLAARVQAMAPPDTVVIPGNTRRLVGGMFDLVHFGDHQLKGFDGDVALYRVAGKASTESRFEAVHGASLTPLVGRDNELALLMERWQRAKHGEGQVVLLCGEPGIGKSRLVRALRECIAAESYLLHSYQCSPYHTNTAFYPIAANFARTAGLEHNDSVDDKLDKLEALVARVPADIGETTPLFAATLEIPTGERYALLDLSPKQQREKTLDALTNGVVRQARLQPMLFIAEDLHWVDPTSLECTTRIIERIRSERVLMVLTYRPEFVPPWTADGHVALITLNRLSRSHGASMVERLTGGKHLPDEIRDAIIDKTDGVPLFVEELTKTLLESRLLRESNDRYELDGPLPPLAIPSTLQDSLMARLDRLSPIKEVAQIAACIGREFSYELLTAITPLNDNELQDALQQLTNGELIFSQGTPPDANYTFKHALVQGTAYESLLKSKRRKLHAQLADVLEHQFPQISETEPELVAHHYTEAGLSEPAIRHWMRASEQAVAKSAIKEATNHLTKALELVSNIPESGEKSELEVTLLNALAAVPSEQGLAS